MHMQYLTTLENWHVMDSSFVKILVRIQIICSVKAYVLLAQFYICHRMRLKIVL
jgi:hypothetical protein